MKVEQRFLPEHRTLKSYRLRKWAQAKLFTVGSKEKRRWAGDELVPEEGRWVGVFSERGAVASGEDFEHPMVKVVDRMIGNRAKAPIVFLAGFVQVHTKTAANILVLTAGFDIFGPQ